MDNPHDKLFKQVYSHPGRAAAYFRCFLPPEAVAEPDLERLELVPGSFIDDALRDRHTDLLFRAPRHTPATAGAEARGAEPAEALVYLLFEDQSTVDPQMAFRLLRYMVRIWERWLAEHTHARRLPPIVPLVLYNGTLPWRVPSDFRSMVADGYGTLSRFTPSFEFLLAALALIPDATLDAVEDGVSRLGLLMLKHARDDDIVTQLRRWADALLEAQALRLLAGFLEYLLSAGRDLGLVALRDTLRHTVNPDAEATAMTVAEQLREEGRQKGRQEGRQEGRDEGRAIALRAAVLRILERRFGPLAASTLARLEAATADELDLWLDRAIDAASVDEALNDPAPH